MNVLKAIKNIRTRHLIEIDVDDLSIIQPTKISVTTQNIKFNTGTHGNQVDVKLNYLGNIVELNNVERIATSVKHQDVMSVGLTSTLTIPTYTKTCKIELLKPLSEEQCEMLIRLFNARYEALKLKTSIHYNYQ